jgi:hypothetical protein
VRVADEGDHPQHLLHPQRDPQCLVVSPSLYSIPLIRISAI